MLPDKLSELIRRGLDALRECERDPAYVIDFDAWHFPKEGRCHVGIVGAYMVGLYGLSPTERRGITGPDSERLFALDLASIGQVEHAILRFCGIRFPWPKEAAPRYSKIDRQPFLFYMADLADRLEAKGL